MNSTKITHPGRLRKLLWLDCSLGSFTGIVGIAYAVPLTSMLGLPYLIIMMIAAVNLIYGMYALFQAIAVNLSGEKIRLLVMANWFWTGLSGTLIYLFYKDATMLGKSLLVIQLVVVGLLAFLEERHLLKGSK